MQCSTAQVTLKAASDLDIVQRIRMVQLALALNMFSQGVAFFHAGALRAVSKLCRPWEGRHEK